MGSNSVGSIPSARSLSISFAKLILEVDGAQHADQKEQDQSPAEFLGASGYQVLRFWNFEVLSDVDSVVKRIALVLRQTQRKGEQQK